MNIKRYVATTEKEAMDMVKSDLGLDAVIMNIRKTEPKGLFKFFRKPEVEVLAALDDGHKEKEVSQPVKLAQQAPDSNIEKKDIAAIESKLERLETLLEQSGTAMVQNQEVSHEDQNPSKYKNEIVELVYQHLIESEIDEEVATNLMKGIDSKDINEVVASVYKRLVKILDKASPVVWEGQQKVVFFVGTTGVGKTTSIAKIAANLIIAENRSVGLITTDTYRIAAVEQLKTYGKILDVPVKVAYTPTELRQAIESYSDKDLILIDSAGCSQKNEDQFRDTVQMLAEVPESEMYLVLSLTTKYKDMCEILEKYSPYKSVKLVFSKLDETNTIGNIINIKCKYSAKLSYITTGQNVPEDIEIVAPSEIAKRLLGGEF